MAGLYVDFGWDMGWALARNGGRITSGVVQLRDGNTCDGMRMLAQTQWYTATLKQIDAANERLTEIVYERITFIGKQNTVETVHAHGKQLGTLERWCALKKLPEPRGIAWDVVKKHVTGHRSAARETVLAEMQKRFPDVRDHNQASALAVMLTAGGDRRTT